MSVEVVYLKNFRNLVEQKFCLHKELTFFIGDNGSGKSSILEALFFVGHGKSFRTTKTDSICHFDEHAFFVNVKNETGSSIGITKNSNEAHFLIKKDGSRLSKLSELANDFAIQIITPESFKLFFGGAKERRKFLDLGVFHVEHSFSNTWKRFSKIHKQRNAVLKSRASVADLEYWTNEFIRYSKEVNTYREEYASNLSQELSVWLEILLPEVSSGITLSFYQGWSNSKELSDVLLEQRERERHLGYSNAGAHKFDLRFFMDGKPIEIKLSRGQQKLFLIALTLAQMKLIERVKQLKAILLIDDFGAELDINSRIKLSEALNNLNCQIAITAIDTDAVNPLLSSTLENNEKYSMFHVEHGELLKKS